MDTKTVTIYKPDAACWVCEDKTVKQVSAQYANVVPMTAFTTKTEADKQATNLMTNPAKAVTVKEIVANVSMPEISWRLVHDGRKVLALFEATGETWTVNNLVCFASQEEALTEIAKLGLDYKPEVIS